MRMFRLLDGYDMDNILLSRTTFYIGLLSVFFYNYLYIFAVGLIHMVYNFFVQFSLSSLIGGYFLHYLLPFNLGDFLNLVNELKERVLNDYNSIFLNIITANNADNLKKNDEENKVNDTSDTVKIETKSNQKDKKKLTDDDSSKVYSGVTTDEYSKYPFKNANLTLKKINDDSFLIQNNNIKTDLTKKMDKDYMTNSQIETDNADEVSED
jgi:hypothetical protein